MPRTKQPTELSKANLMDTPERFKLGESGYLGLNVFDGVTNEELKRELNFPYSIKTYKEMSYHPTIGAALTLYHNLITKVDWSFKPPVGATEEEKRQCKIVAEMMHDMEHPWTEFVSDIMSAQLFGFSVHEKVYRRRLLSNGSKFNDGLIGWRKLPIRSQETIEKFIFSDDGNEILGVKQDLSAVNDLYNRYASRLIKEVVLPRSKFMLFRVGKHKGDPFGKSPLRDAYSAWRYLTVIEEIEANGVAKDLSGFPVLSIPPQYMSADASPAQRAIYDYYRNAMRNLQMNQQSALILPNAYDPETRQPLFKLELLSLDGKKAIDTTKVKEYYRNLILTALFADVLTLGQEGSGSFALGQLKNSLSGSAAEAILRSITSTLNHELVKQTYELNGWDVSRMGAFDYSNLESEDLESFSKSAQRMGAVGLIEADREFLNRVRRAMGVDPMPEDMEPREQYMPNFTSRSGDGMATAGEGTSTTVSAENASDNNLENVG
jgi:hypothetical protein